MKWLIGVSLLVCLFSAQMALSAPVTFGSDFASNYGASWTNGSNGGTGFGAWEFDTSDGGDDPFLVADSTQGGAGRQSVGDPAFGLSAYSDDGQGKYVHAKRLISKGALSYADVLQFEWNFYWNGGNRGLDLFSDAAYGTKILNIRTDGDPLVMDIEGGATGIQLMASKFQKAVTIELTQISLTKLNVRAIVDGADEYNQTHTVVGSIQGLDFYAGGANDLFGGEDANFDVYINNFVLVSNTTMVITDPATTNATVGNGVATYDVAGVANGLTGVLSWTNSFTGDAGTVNAVETWVISNVALNVGNNIITVSGTNATESFTETVDILRTDVIPGITITNPATDIAVSEGTASYVISGTNVTGYVGDITWTNSHTMSGGVAFIVDGTHWTASIGLDRGVNAIEVSVSNATGQVATDTVNIDREATLPQIDISDPSSDISVPNSQTNDTVSGSASNWDTTGNINWQVWPSGQSGSLPFSSAWIITNIALDTGANVITVTATNRIGGTGSDTVTITRDDNSAFVWFTNPSNDINVANTVLDRNIYGELSNAFGLITISNNLTGEVRTQGVATSWSFTNMVLYAGDNLLTVSVSNQTGQIAVDTVTVTRDYIQEDVWINEIHFVNVGVTDVNEGIEIAGPASAALGQNIIYLYGSDGRVYHTNALTGIIPNETNGLGAVWFDYGSDTIQNGPSDGIALTYQSTLLEFISYRGTVTAIEGVASGQTSTDIGVTEERDTPTGYSVQLQGIGTNRAAFTWGGPYTNSYGLLNAVQIVSADYDGNGIPDVWQDVYFGASSTIDETDDPDGDGYTTWEEFKADTDPTVDTEYPQVLQIDFSGSYPVLSWDASSERLYQVQVTTNLVDGSWTNINDTFWGVSTGGMMHVTMPAATAPFGAYRYEVSLPGVD